MDIQADLLLKHVRDTRIFFSEVVSVMVNSVGNGRLMKLNYEYGELETNGTTVDVTKNSGNIAKQTLTFNGLANPFVQTFKYDPLYRLTEAKETSNGNQTWRQNFGYDRYGNRTTHEKFIGTTQLTLDETVHPEIDNATNRVIGGQGFTFDANGNLIVDAQGRQFTFNGDNKQTLVKDDQNNEIGKYFYDGEGRRIKKIIPLTGETTIFVYSAGKLIAEYSTETPPQNPTTSYTVTDQLGSPRVIVDALGQVVSRRDFMPFGEEVDVDGTYRTTAQGYGEPDIVRQRFTGYQKDDETGLDFAEARMYQNLHGRFTAVDPLLASGKSADPQTFNRYVYVMNNPLMYTDPTGLQAGSSLGFSFSVYVRAFAPYKWFGPGNVARGDDRGFSTAPGASYRIQASTEMIARNDGISHPFSVTRPSPPTTSETNLGSIYYPGINVAWTAQSESYINNSNGNYAGSELFGGVERISYHMYGNDDAIPLVSSDIDLHPNFWFKFDESQGNGIVDMTVTGSVIGDQFPAAEAFIRDSSGNAVMLGTFAPSSSSGPVLSLPFDNRLPMIDVNVTVRVNNGVFQGVVENGSVVSLDEYNRRFTSQSAVRPNQ